jgi:transcriptional regulator with XRE-family HTH domain
MLFVYDNVNVNINMMRSPEPVYMKSDERVSIMASALAERLENIKELGGIAGRDVAQLLDTTPETVSRWSTGKIDPQRERLQRLLELEFFLTELAEFYSPEEAKLWLFSPHKLLGGESAAARIQAGKIQDVFALLDQLRSGVYI